MKALNAYITALRDRMRRMRRDLFFSPERYWVYLLTLVAAWALIVVIADGYIFWRLALSIDKNVTAPDVPVERLDRQGFDTALEMLANRQNLYQQTLTGLPQGTATTTIE